MFALGVWHACGPDHLAAIATLSRPDRSAMQILLVALRFATGHAALLFAAALAFSALEFIPSAGWMRMAETAGGVALMLLGVSALHDAVSHGQTTALHPSFWGALLAASGTRSILLAVTAAAGGERNLGWIVVLTAAFALGIIVGMLMFGWFWAKATRRFANRGLGRPVGFAVGLASLSLGFVWAVSEWI